MRAFYYYITLILIGFLTACSHPDDRAIQNVELDTKFIDLHLELSQLDTHDVQKSVHQLVEKHPSFIPFLMSEIAALDTTNDYSDSMVRLFFTHPDLRNLHDTVAQVFKQTDKIQKELSQLLKRIKVKDPDIQVPTELYFYSSGLHHVAFTLQDTMLGIGLDRFFGEDYWPYESMGHPTYLTRNFTIENIPLEAAKVIYHNKYGDDYEQKNFLELMITEGKMLYFIKEVLPGVGEDRILGYTPEQYKWCSENEVFIYKFFADQNLFYEKSHIKTMRYIAPNPTSMGMPEQSPGRTGAYLGFQIIKSYAKQTGKSLSEILHTPEQAQTILSKAKYKPKR